MNLKQREIRAIISGGGTGGHIFPAIAIADTLKKINPRSEFLFVGAKGRMEMEKVPAAGYRIEGLEISGMQRSLSLKNLILPFKILKSILKARRIIKQFSPDVAIGVGGYASGPLLYAATGMKIPSLIQEQNSFAGVTNKLLAKRVQSICVAYDGMEKFFPEDKIIITGNPVRQEMTNTDGKRNDAFEFFKLDPSKKTILIIGGSLGARTINESVEGGIKKFAGENVQLIWQTGKNYFEKAKKNSMPGLFITDFIQRMDYAYSAADVIISRAGASSVSELSLVGKPSILVPSPNVAEDHQTKNAMSLVDKNAAWLVRDSDARNDLVARSLELIKDKSQQQVLSENIKKIALKDSAQKIAEEVYKIIKNK